MISNEIFSWLELIDGSAFCVKDGAIIAANTAAEKRSLRIGTDIRQIVTAHRAEYETFQDGELYLTISVEGLPCSASVLRTREFDIFRLHGGKEDGALQALALASVQLRIPLANAMTAADELLRSLPEGAEAGHLTRNLFQLMRIIGNMADANSNYNTSMQVVDISALINEIAKKVQTFCEDSGVTLEYTGVDAPIFSLANSEKLERAVYNLLSNALKFAPSGSAVTASLSKSGSQVIFTVTNSASETPSTSSFWQQYLREPAIEDPRRGLGLGMTLVTSAAALHGGTVLVDRPATNKVRVTMAIPISSDDSTTVRSPILRISDYAGGWDKGLIELSEILSANVYNKD